MIAPGHGAQRARRVLIAAGLAACLPFGADARPFQWPGGAEAAVSLAYDDAVASQLDSAVPALARAGLKASFYLTLSSPAVAARLPEWRAVAAAGHELGNHTLFHQCSAAGPGRDWVAPENDLDTTSVAQMAAQIRLANTMLQAIDGRVERTFTVPCGDVMAGGGNYLPAIRQEFVAIKSGAGGVVPDMDTLDLHAVPVWAPEAVTGAQLIAMVEAARREGTMLNITFHGVGGDHLAVSAQAHEALLRYLADHRDTVWTDTFLNIMKHVEGARAPGP